MLRQDMHLVLTEELIMLAHDVSRDDVSPANCICLSIAPIAIELGTHPYTT
jgi:hypothetical protein